MTARATAGPSVSIPTMSSIAVAATDRPVTAVGPAPRDSRGRGTPWTAWLLVGLIAVGAGALRLVGLGQVRLDPFYDAAVRSMGTSWHNFFLGAFEPGGSVSIDKPPVDLWLQVISVKLLGFTSATLKLPEALGGTLAVPVLFAAVRRLFGTPAGLAAALALAVLPIEVLTSRSDTMDAVMMFLLALALLFTVRAGESGGLRWLLLAAGALGLAFNVKLLEALVPLPGLALFAYLALPGTRRRRLSMLLAAGSVFVVVSLSWLSATLLFPSHERPFAIGSTNGSAWNAAFVFNGYDRIAGKATQTQDQAFSQSRHYPERTQAERDHIPITPPAPTRLLTRIGPLSGERLGFMLLAALLLGVPALFALSRRRPASRAGPSTVTTNAETIAALDPQGPRPTGAATEPRWRLRRAASSGLVLWLVSGIVLFTVMKRLHPRYVEGFTPAVAAVLGVGIACVSSYRARQRPLVLAGGLLVAVVLLAYAARLLYGATAIWWLTLVATLAAVAGLSLGAVATRRGVSAAVVSGLTLAFTCVALLAIPLKTSLATISGRLSDAGHVGDLRPDQVAHLSRYLHDHQGGARYEVATASATQAASLIVKDARPVIVLTTYDARTLTSVARLRQLIGLGQVRYAIVQGFCGPHTSRLDASCSAPAQWARSHGQDVSREAGLARDRVLWRLPRALA